MKTLLALVLLAALCVVVSGCGSGHRVVFIGPHKTGFDCGNVRVSQGGHLWTVKRIPCTGYHPVPGSKK